MTYTVKEIFASLQGEGARSGRPAVLLRFSGCNLWTGREEDRSDAVCSFCDTDFLGTDGMNGGRYRDAAELADRVAERWDDTEGGRPYAVLTGGEPLLQVDHALIDELHRRGFEVALETNGTIPAPAEIDWICVSPKAGAALEQRAGNELKLVYPQDGVDPAMFEHLKFEYFFLQPLFGPDVDRHTAAAFEYSRAHPLWRVSIQTHKLAGIR